ncbi:MAG: multidrug effflux MFS transporter [Gammaproteobacteria bacterium]|nr:multidrug effflux MFS transporter [Gammaproteobacteria bacterium]
MKGNANSSIGLILVVAFVSMIGPFSIDTYLPSFPAIEAEFQVSRDWLSQTIAIYLAATAISTLFWGPLSDRIGRKRVILGTLVLYFMASLACALASDYSSFLLFRVFQGMAASGGLVAGRAMVRDAYDSDSAHRAMSYVLMLFALAPAIAPIVGGWLHDAFGWRSVFYFLSAYGGVMLLASARVINETLHKTQRQSFHPLYVLRVYGRTLLHGRFLAIVLALSTSFGGLFLYIAGSPTLIFNFLALETNDFAVQFVPMTVGIIAGSFISGRLAHRWPITRVVSLALGIMVCASLLNLLQAVWLVPTVVTVIAPLVLYAFGVALAMPGFGILAIDCFPNNKGSAAAVQAFMQIMFSGLVAGLMLPLLTESVMGYALGQLLLLAAALIFWCLPVRIRSVEN